MVITSEKVQKNNDRMTCKKLGRILNANFDSDSWHLTLTYADAPDPEEAQAEFKRFISRLRRLMKKSGLELKWVMAMEYKNTRLHHHFVTNAPIGLAQKAWTSGKIISRQLFEDPNYYRLGEYLIKETTKTFRNENSCFKTRYSHSRNLVIPKPQIEYVDERQLFDDPEPRKGYYIDPETVRRFEHPVTGLEHLEYMMISIEEEPRIKKYYKGKTKKREENFERYINYAEEQQSLII